MSSACLVRGRFAPSPTGRMHAGNIFAAMCAWLVSRSCDGRIVLRIEDLDEQRSRPEHASQIQRDFESFGLSWDEGPYYQSDRKQMYLEAFESLKRLGRVYPCFCSRADLHAASAPQDDGRYVYNRTCADLSEEDRAALSSIRQPASRLSVGDATVSFRDELQGPCAYDLKQDVGDFIIRRHDGNFSYQLAVVVDDADQGITSVVRGVDLLTSCSQQIYLQSLLNLPRVSYCHIPLIVDGEGRRLAKRHKDASVDELLVRFKTPQGVIGHIAGVTGLMPTGDPATMEEVLAYASSRSLGSLLKDRHAIVY